MKKIIAIAVLAMVAGMVQADAISVNWTQYTGAVNLIADGYGVEAANNWNNSTGTTWTDQMLSSGASSTIDITATAPAGMVTAAGGGVYNNTAMRAGAFVYANPMLVTLSDISATFEDGYDIIVYGASFEGAAGGNQGSYTVGTTTYYMQRVVTPNATLVQSSDINLVDGVDVGNYVVFSGLSGDTQSITIATVNGSTGIGGFQVVGTVIPEPATVGMLGLGALVTLLVRRFKRA